MTRTELINNLKNFLINKDELVAEIYFILKHYENTYLKFADIDETSQIALTRQFIERIETDIINDDDLDVISISSDDDRLKVLYEYDLDEVPEELTLIDKIIETEDLPEFSFTTDKIDDIKGFLILIQNNGQTLVLYKQNYPINIYKKDASFYLRSLGNTKRFTKLNDDFIKINSSFEFFKFESKLFIKNLSTLEKFFGFHKIIQKKAQSSLKLIENSGILSNPESLSNMLEDISFARKLTKVTRSSPVLGKIPTEAIVAFSSIHPALKGKIKFNAESTKIILDSKNSKKLFIKLLNDDYLLSELTKENYDSLAKDRIKVFK
jgi:hypothetical protein